MGARGWGAAAPQKRPLRSPSGEAEAAPFIGGYAGTVKARHDGPPRARRASPGVGVRHSGEVFAREDREIAQTRHVARRKVEIDLRRRRLCDEAAREIRE